MSQEYESGELSGRLQERIMIQKYLKERLDSLSACTKNDSCKDIAYVVDGIMKDIQDGEHYEDD